MYKVLSKSYSKKNLKKRNFPKNNIYGKKESFYEYSIHTYSDRPKTKQITNLFNKHKALYVPRSFHNPDTQWKFFFANQSKQLGSMH